MNSIIQKETECFRCRTLRDLHKHHIFGGTANRKLSEKYGLTVYLCGKHHNSSDEGIHNNPDYDLQMKQLAQMAFEQTRSRQEFMQIFGRNYL